MSGKIGFVGLGNMGASFSVVVHDLDPGKVQALGYNFARQLGVPARVAALTEQVYQMAGAAGLNKQDGSSVVRVFEQMAGDAATTKG